MILRRFSQHIKEQNWFAVGLDIIVVIVGIYLGMQVTELKDKRLDSEYEQTVLVELQKAIHGDINYIENHLLNFRNKLKRDVHHYFSDMIQGKEVDGKEFNKNFYWLKWSNGFQINDGAYESIKSSGLDKISNPEIRRLLTKAYEFDIPRYAEFIQLTFVELEKVSDRELPYLQKEPVAEFDSGELDIETYPKDFNVTSNPHFLRLLEQSIRSESTSSNAYKTIVKRLRELDTLISKEMSSK